MTNDDIKSLIAQSVRQTVAQSGLPFFRDPLIGYAAATDPLFGKLPEVVGPGHLAPVSLLPAVRTVLAFFLPFRKEITDRNRRCLMASREWAEAYIATNQLINRIYADLEQQLQQSGVAFVSQPPTYEFDKDLLIANWSHRHIAYICGLGSFGRNNLLITVKGSGGRFGSGVMDAAVEPTGRAGKSHECLYDTTGCRYCEKICPVGAIGSDGFQRQLCYRQCMANDDYYPDLELSDVCGKCLTGPCSYRE